MLSVARSTTPLCFGFGHLLTVMLMWSLGGSCRKLVSTTHVHMHAYHWKISHWMSHGLDFNPGGPQLPP